MTDRAYNRLSGWCSQHGRPACDRCKWDDCACPSDVCVAKRGRSEMAKQSGNERVSAVVGWDNSGPTKDGPGDSLRQQRAVVPGPRQSLVRSDRL